MPLIIRLSSAISILGKLLIFERLLFRIWTLQHEKWVIYEPYSFRA